MGLLRSVAEREAAEADKHRPDAGGREIGHLPVVLVAAALFPHRLHERLTYGTKAWLHRGSPQCSRTRGSTTA